MTIASAVPKLAPAFTTPAERWRTLGRTGGLPSNTGPEWVTWSLGSVMVIARSTVRRRPTARFSHGLLQPLRGLSARDRDGRPIEVELRDLLEERLRLGRPPSAVERESVLIHEIYVVRVRCSEMAGRGLEVLLLQRQHAEYGVSALVLLRILDIGEDASDLVGLRLRGCGVTLPRREQAVVVRDVRVDDLLHRLVARSSDLLAGER